MKFVLVRRLAIYIGACSMLATSIHEFRNGDGSQIQRLTPQYRDLIRECIRMARDMWDAFEEVPV